MAHLFVIAGHGAGDPGACGNGYQEAERVRALAARIKALGGDNVTVADTLRNWYADNGISSLKIPKDWQILELHMDSAAASARGGHVIIYSGFSPDSYDEALASFIKGMFPGRSIIISKRSDLANPSRAAAKGYGYRLLECCFISNASDVAKFNANMDELARGILGSFGIAGGSSGGNEPKPQPSPKPQDASIEQLAREVIDGKHGNGEERKRKLGANYEAVQRRVNEILGAGGSVGSVDIEKLAREVIDGKHGNGEERKRKLGANYEAVQRRVNEILS